MDQYFPSCQGQYKQWGKTTVVNPKTLQASFIHLEKWQWQGTLRGILGGAPSGTPLADPCAPSCLAWALLALWNAELHITMSFVSTQQTHIKTRGRPSGWETESLPAGYGEFLPWQKISAKSTKIPARFLFFHIINESSDNYLSAIDLNFFKVLQRAYLVSPWNCSVSGKGIGFLVFEEITVLQATKDNCAF